MMPPYDIIGCSYHDFLFPVLKLRVFAFEFPSAITFPSIVIPPHTVIQRPRRYGCKRVALSVVPTQEIVRKLNAEIAEYTRILDYDGAETSLRRISP